MAMTTLRIPDSLEQRLKEYALAKKLTKSEAIKSAIEQLLARDAAQADAFSLGKDLFGKDYSGLGILSQDYKVILKEKLRAKYRAR